MLPGYLAIILINIAIINITKHCSYKYYYLYQLLRIFFLENMQSEIKVEIWES